MGKRLTDNISSAYIGAANQLKPKGAKKKIVAYVESYDDILFWRTLLSEFENDKFYFQVMLPSAETLVKGKKAALMNRLGCGLGQNMIACVDADYDYLLQGTTETSRRITRSPYVFHTYAYAIENFQCYAEDLHEACVMATLNDHKLLELPEFMKIYSQIIYPLFIWSVWFYRKKLHSRFSITDFGSITGLEGFSLKNPEQALEALTRRVRNKLRFIEKKYAKAKPEIEKMKEELAGLGVTPENTYLFIQGHHLFENVVMKLLTPICNQLRRERETEIKYLAEHSMQMQNELTSYQHSGCSIEFILRKNTGYKEAPLYDRIRQDISRMLEKME